MKGAGDPGTTGKRFTQPFAVGDIGILSRQPQDQAAPEARRQIRALEMISALPRPTAPEGDQFREVAVTLTIAGQQHQARTVLQADFTADDNALTSSLAAA